VIADSGLSAAAALGQVKDLVGESIIDVTIEDGNRLLIRLEARELPVVARALRDDATLAYKYLTYITATDYEDHIESVYYLRSIQHLIVADLRIEMDSENPTVPSVSSIWRTACWHERETYDFFGIIYTGHPELNRILTGVKGGVHPLRKKLNPKRVPRKEWQWPGLAQARRLPGETDRKTRS
jgi:NADH-quinone oxidoreductase subunit C